MQVNKEGRVNLQDSGMLFRSLCFSGVLGVLAINVANAQDLDSAGFMSGYRLMPGVRAHSMEFSVENAETLDDKGTLGEDLSYSPFVLLGSPYRFFGDSNFGTYVEYGISGFSLNKQIVNDSLVDLGTSVNGWHVFVTPAIFYNIGDRAVSGDKGRSLKLGIGVGIGYVDARGDIIFTETTQERHTFNINGLGLGISILADMRWRNLMVRASAGGASVDQGELAYDSLRVAIDVGYVFEF